MTIKHPSVSGVLLAAGQSSRVPGSSPKQLLPVEGEPLVFRLARETLSSRLREVVIVLGHASKEVRQVLSNLPVTIVENKEYAQGQSTSVKAGLRSIAPTASAVLFIPADQPFLTAAVFNRLIAVYESSGKSIVLPAFQGRRGAPVLFDRRLFTELTAITGDEGGRQILERHEPDIEIVELNSERPLFDIDTPEDYEKLIGRTERRR